MTLADLLRELERQMPGLVLDGDAAVTLDKARGGTHRHALAGNLIAALGAGLSSAEAAISRSRAITALGPIRLICMKDDAPVEDFRLVERWVHAIDGAYNDEALRNKQEGGAG